MYDQVSGPTTCQKDDLISDATTVLVVFQNVMQVSAAISSVANTVAALVIDDDGDDSVAVVFPDI